jgi:hypothetical protein
MPSWKKVIISGSRAELSSLIAPSITGSLQGTASFATTASTLTPNTNAFIQGGNSFGTTALLGTNDNQNLNIETSGSVRMTVSSSGNVGIGTTTPTAKLDVNGSFRFGPLGTIGGTYFQSWTYGTDLVVPAGTTGGWARAHRITTSDVSGSVFFGVYGNDTTLDRAYWTIGTPGDSEGGHAFTTGVHLLKNGNVGIGTYIPTAKLTVQTSGSDDNLNAMIANFGKSSLSTAYGSTFIRVARHTTTTTQGAGDYTDIDHNSAGQTPHRYGTFGDTNIINGNRLTNGPYGNINFVTSGSTRMTIAGGTSAGFVGIGTTNPSASLHTTGSVIVANSMVIGSSSLGPSENTLTLGARDSVQEGGQLGFNASGGTYTSASFIDLYQNRLRILKGTNATSTGEVANWNMHNLQMALPAYSSVSSFPGTAAGYLAFDAGGNVITVAAGNPFPFTGSAQITGSLGITGSLSVSAGITGSLFGTASFATTASRAITSSFALTASFVTGSNVFGPFGSNSVTSASFAVSASRALTSSFALTATSASYATTSSLSLASTSNQLLVINKSGATIAKGVVVHLTGSTNSSDTPYITTASYESDNLSANSLGITAESIAFNSTGFVTTEGVLTGLNVTGFVAGQLVYLGANGAIIGAAPQAPLHGVRLGQVVRDSPSNNGSIYVRIDNGYEIGELHDVIDSTTTSSYGDLLVKSGSVWTNSKQLTGSYELTGSLTVTGSTTTDLIRITQTGTGNAFRVEDSSNPDNTPFLIDNVGNVMIGTTSSKGAVTIASNGADGLVLDTDTASNTQSSRLFFKNSGSFTDFSIRNTDQLLVIAASASAGVATGTGRLYISASGEVSIGTGYNINTSRGAILQLSGSINIEDGFAYKQDGENVIYIQRNTGLTAGAFNNTIAGQNAAEGTAYFDQMTAFGYTALYESSGSDQTAFGYAAGSFNSGSSQTLIGWGAGYQGKASNQTAVGEAAGYANTGSNQTAVGIRAGQYNSGSNQTAIGADAGVDNTATQQTAVGLQAGIYNIGVAQTAIGQQAGQNNSGSTQTAVGYAAGYQNSGSLQVAIGSQAGRDNIGALQTVTGYEAGRLNIADNQSAYGYRAGYENSGSNQTAIGTLAGRFNSGSNQTAVGVSAGEQNIGNTQTAIGAYAGYANTGSAQTAVGYEAGRLNIADFQTAVGYSAGYANTGSAQTAYGYQAGAYNSGSNQTATGYQAGVRNLGTNQTATGWQAGYENTGSNQTAYGYQAGFKNSGSNQVAMGNSAGEGNLGNNQTALGSQAGYLNTGSSQTAVGSAAGYQNSGSDQVVSGYRSGYQNKGDDQTATGYEAGFQNTGIEQSAFGWRSGYQNSGANMTAVGSAAGYQNSGSGLVAVGVDAGRTNKGTQNTFIGFQAGYFTTGATVNTLSTQSVFLGGSTTAGGASRTNQIVIGYNAEGIGSNSVVLGNSSILTTALRGFVGIGTTTPTASLHVNNTTTSASFLVEDSTNPDTTPFVIDSSGDVGIGTTTPTAKLDIVYAASVGTGVLIRGGGGVLDSTPLKLWDIGTAVNNRNIIEFAHNSTYVTASRIYSTNPSPNATTGGKLVLETTSDNIGTFNTSQLVLSNNGNVGIGTDTPTYTLQIQAAPTASIRLQETGSGGNKRLDLTIDGSGTARISANQSAQSMAFDTVGSERIRITSTGNVGINKTTPNATLDVSGSTIISGSLTVTGGITGSITASGVFGPYGANSIISASYAATASYAAFAPSTIQTSGSTIYSTNPATTNFTTANSIFLGFGSGFGTMDTAFNCVMIGGIAGMSASNSTGATFIGYNAGGSAAGSSQAVMLGFGTGTNSTNCSHSVMIGANAGANQPNSTNSVIIGSNSGNGGGLGPNNIIIGADVTLPYGAENSINIGGIIFGKNVRVPTLTDSPEDTAAPDGRIGIGVVSPRATLDVSGSFHVEGTYKSPSGNTIDSNALIQAGLLYLSNNF